MNQDQFSEFSRKAINILFVSNPKGTSIGILAGVLLHGIAGLFTPTLKAIEWINIGALKVWHYICFAVIGLNMPSYFKRTDIDPSIKKAISFIQEQHDSKKINDWQARQMYTQLLQQVIENIVVEHNAAEKVKKITSLAAQNQPDEKKPE
ncbi:hypothetical protein [Pseudomonas huaxiensis]|uniref:hypothetical protein n=1 Tax=Pseudomonas huaxiensis TaxID=2213017 RepID=UPI000DA66935|nr:hypothetical protein [Pseudomonas huaxiensis]